MAEHALVPDERDPLTVAVTPPYRECTCGWASSGPQAALQFIEHVMSAGG